MKACSFFSLWPTIDFTLIKLSFLRLIKKNPLKSLAFLMLSANREIKTFVHSSRLNTKLFHNPYDDYGAFISVIKKKSVSSSFLLCTPHTHTQEMKWLGKKKKKRNDVFTKETRKSALITQICQLIDNIVLLLFLDSYHYVYLVFFKHLSHVMFHVIMQYHKIAVHTPVKLSKLNCLLK